MNLSASALLVSFLFVRVRVSAAFLVIIGCCVMHLQHISASLFCVRINAQKVAFAMLLLYSVCCDVALVCCLLVLSAVADASCSMMFKHAGVDGFESGQVSHALLLIMFGCAALLFEDPCVILFIDVRWVILVCNVAHHIIWHRCAVLLLPQHSEYFV